MKKTLKSIISLALMILLTASAVSFGAIAANDYWGYTDYDTFENPGAPAEITSYETTITKKPTASTYGYESEYLMECQTEAGRLYMTIQETTWGTFNLGMWYLIDNSGVKHQFVEGYTDLEYVYRASKDGSTWVWSGGNHGNEALISLEFYNGETGEQIVLGDYESATVNILHIIQKTKLLWQDADSEGYGFKDKDTDTYTDDDVYAEVTRKYTVTGPQIKLNVDYTHVQDTYFFQSYTCMFPIRKAYGLYCDMYDKEGNFLKSVITPETDSNFTGDNNSGNMATRALIYGKNNSQYQFDVRINTYQDSLDGQQNSYKTAFWDMSSSNKLYFTKYPLYETATPLIESGTEFHTECIWLFKYDPDGRTPTEGEIPVTLNKSYDISVTNDPVTSEEYNVYYGANLTDGKASTTFNASDNSWFAIWPGINTDANRVGSITVDLGAEYDLTSISLNLANKGDYGVTAPTKIEAFIGNDDGEFTSVGEFTINTGTDAIYTTSIDFEATGSKIRIDITVPSNSTCAYINEISGYGTKTADTATDTEEGPQDNLASGLGYSISVTDEPVKDSQWGTSYCANLTDGIAAETFSATDDSWFVFSSYQNVENDIGTFTVDLGKTCDITKIRLHLSNQVTSMGVGAPSKVTAYALIDGEYASIGDFDLNTSDTVIYWTEIDVENVQTDTVMVEFTLNGAFAYVNEIEVHGSEAVIAEPSYIRGDVNSDSEIKATDYLLLKRILLGAKDMATLNDPETAEQRCDINNNGEVNSTDYLLLKRYLIGAYQIVQ